MWSISVIGSCAEILEKLFQLVEIHTCGVWKCVTTTKSEFYWLSTWNHEVPVLKCCIRNERITLFSHILVIHDFCSQSRSCQARTGWMLCCPVDRTPFDTEGAQCWLETYCQSPSSLAHCYTLVTSGQVGEGTYSHKDLLPQRKAAGLQVTRSDWGKQFFLICNCIFSLFHLCEILCKQHWNTTK